jgi:hypothetical protein
MIALLWNKKDANDHHRAALSPVVGLLLGVFGING